MKTHLIEGKHLARHCRGWLALGAALTVQSVQAQWVCEDYVENHWGSSDIIQLQDGGLMVTSDLEGPNGYEEWSIRWRDPATGLWSPVDQFQEDADFQMIWTGGLAQAPDGAVYAVGHGRAYVKKKGNRTIGAYRGIVRKGTFSNGSWTWTTVDRDTTSGGSVQDGYNDVAIGPNGEIVAVGFSGVYQSWLMLRSADGGNSWTTIGEYQGDSTSNYQEAHGATFDAEGNLYVVGSVRIGRTVEVYGKGKKPRNEIIYENKLATLRLAAGASQFEVLDIYQSGDARYTYGRDVIFTSDGMIIVVGDAYGGDSDPENWVVRVSTDDGATWLTADEFGVPGDKAHGNKAQSVTESPEGIIHITGNAWNPVESRYHPTIRSSVDFSTWDTEIVTIISGGGRGISGMVIDEDALYISIPGWRVINNQCPTLRYDLTPAQ